jgi:hypothetical protein
MGPFARFAAQFPTIALGGGLIIMACCPATSGPTAAAVGYSATLAPGALEFYDVDIPASTTQINLDFTLDSVINPLRLRQIEVSCLPAPDDSCQSFYDATMPPRPSGVFRFGNALQPHGPRTRIVLQNLSNENVTYTVTITPHRAGCT